MGTGLRNLVKTCPQIKGGKRRAHSTIYSKITPSKNPADINTAVQKIKANIMAGLHYCIENDTPSEQHKLCKDESVSWCKYEKHLQEGSSISSADHF